MATLVIGCAGHRTGNNPTGPEPAPAHHAQPPTATPPAEPKPDQRAQPQADAEPAPQAQQPQAQPAAPIELAPGLRAHLGERWVEFDAIVPIDAHQRDRTGYRLVRYLEAIAVTPASGKDHEALALARITPSLFHAALLAIGLEPGSPGAIAWDGSRAVATPASGQRVTVTLRPRGAAPPGRPVREHIVHADTGEPFGHGGAGARWVFAGSRTEAVGGGDAERYLADAQGLLVGLHTFGSEVVSLREAMSPDSWVLEPVWIANHATLPTFGMPVVVRIAPAD